MRCPGVNCPFPLGVAPAASSAWPGCLSHKFSIDSTHLWLSTHTTHAHTHAYVCFAVHLSAALSCICRAHGFDSVMRQPGSLHLCIALGQQFANRRTDTERRTDKQTDRQTHTLQSTEIERERKEKCSGFVRGPGRMCFTAKIPLIRHLFRSLSFRWLLHNICSHPPAGLPFVIFSDFWPYASLRPSSPTSLPPVRCLPLFTHLIVGGCCFNFHAHLKGLKGYSSNSKLHKFLQSQTSTTLCKCVYLWVYWVVFWGWHFPSIAQ